MVSFSVCLPLSKAGGIMFELEFAALYLEDYELTPEYREQLNETVTNVVNYILGKYQSNSIEYVNVMNFMEDIEEGIIGDAELHAWDAMRSRLKLSSRDARQRMYEHYKQAIDKLPAPRHLKHFISLYELYRFNEVSSAWDYLTGAVSIADLERDISRLQQQLDGAEVDESADDAGWEGVFTEEELSGIFHFASQWTDRPLALTLPKIVSRTKDQEKEVTVQQLRDTIFSSDLAKKPVKHKTVSKNKRAKTDFEEPDELQPLRSSLMTAREVSRELEKQRKEREKEEREAERKAQEEEDRRARELAEEARLRAQREAEEFADRLLANADEAPRVKRIAQWDFARAGSDPYTPARFRLIGLDRVRHRGDPGPLTQAVILDPQDDRWVNNVLMVNLQQETAATRAGIVDALREVVLPFRNKAVAAIGADSQQQKLVQTACRQSVSLLRNDPNAARDVVDGLLDLTATLMAAVLEAMGPDAQANTFKRQQQTFVDHVVAQSVAMDAPELAGVNARERKRREDERREKEKQARAANRGLRKRRSTAPQTAQQLAGSRTLRAIGGVAVTPEEAANALAQLSYWPGLSSVLMPVDRTTATMLVTERLFKDASAKLHHTTSPSTVPELADLYKAVERRDDAVLALSYIREQLDQAHIAMRRDCLAHMYALVESSIEDIAGIPKARQLEARPTRHAAMLDWHGLQAEEDEDTAHRRAWGAFTDEVMRANVLASFDRILAANVEHRAPPPTGLFDDGSDGEEDVDMQPQEAQPTVKPKVEKSNDVIIPKGMRLDSPEAVALILRQAVDEAAEIEAAADMRPNNGEDEVLSALREAQEAWREMYVSNAGLRRAFSTTALHTNNATAQCRDAATYMGLPVAQDIYRKSVTQPCCTRSNNDRTTLSALMSRLGAIGITIAGEPAPSLHQIKVIRRQSNPADYGMLHFRADPEDDAAFGPVPKDHSAVNEMCNNALELTADAMKPVVQFIPVYAKGKKRPLIELDAISQMVPDILNKLKSIGQQRTEGLGVKEEP
ncbi:hypothetical protein J8273_3409 [Carpediemonas membranifera]|uniref:Uncharacterized protein n=1 Tax=Carpediemonas membranifera TaxID=201153 RepID=A0A8J6BXA8_9EUKA|nr:hypothetical protein J8273_3409 [Carpediemonas membranifera]|eukprot:KAG9393276.1 hypothetical protein J8273_3409 [Carpediemonas membranifera]